MEIEATRETRIIELVRLQVPLKVLEMQALVSLELVLRVLTSQPSTSANYSLVLLF